jgi:translocation protein SEC66
MQFRKRLEEVQTKMPAEREWWEKRRATIETELLKEVDEEEAEKASTGKPASEEDAVLVDAGSPPASAPASAAATPAKPAAKPSAPSTPAENTPVGTPSKKKKGKK